MTLTDDDPTTTLPPQRSWRELPESPPLADIAAPPAAHTYPTTPPTGTPGIGTAAPPVGPGSDEAELSGEEGPSRRRRAAVVIAVLALLAGGVAGVAVALGSDGDGSVTPTVSDSGEGSPADVAAALGPAVVQIDLLGGLDAGGGVGSGVIYDTSGLVLTAHHVVAGADEVTVRTADDREIDGRVVGRSPERDLAVVALAETDGIVAARIAETGSVEVGEPAVALGSPFGFSQSVTAGIISGLDRELETPVGTLTGLIQTDAPINPGNSGGPLADESARVIGINTAIASISGGNDGVGFAVPVEDFADLLDDVEAAGGADAPTVPAPEGEGFASQIPGLGQVPGLDQLPGLDDLLDDMFGSGGTPDELDQLLEELFFGEDFDEELEGALDDAEEALDGALDDAESFLDGADDLLDDMFGSGDSVPADDSDSDRNSDDEGVRS